MLIYGVQTKDNALVVPSMIDVLFTQTFSLTYSLSIDKNSDYLVNDFASVDNLLTALSIKNSDLTIPDITSYMISKYGQTLNRYINNFMLSTISDFIIFIKKNICQLLNPIVFTISNQLSNYILSNNTIVLSPNIFIDAVFDHLSLSTASISLTIWSG